MEAKLVVSIVGLFGAMNGSFFLLSALPAILLFLFGKGWHAEYVDAGQIPLAFAANVILASVVWWFWRTRDR